ncbi:MAG: alpha/beta hydrolase [Verrucomicrobiales bacterium]|nr:alpha/beta hydrolase [Verrucomicrobiales bacterium]
MRGGILRLGLFGAAMMASLCATAGRGEFTASDGVRLSYLESGRPDRPALVFVPGWMCPAWIWEKQITYFQESYHVVALDPRAQGESDRGAADLTPARRSRDIVELLAHLQLDRVVLVAWSMAVGEALGYIEQNGAGNLRALVLVDGFLGQDPTKESLLGRQAWLSGILTNRSAFMDGFFKMFFHESPPTEWVTRLRSDIDRTPAPAAFTLQATAAPLNRMPILEGLTLPVLFVHQTMLDREAARLKERAPKVEVVRMEGVGHALFVEKADEFNRAVETFLDQRASRR